MVWYARAEFTELSKLVLPTHVVDLAAHPLFLVIDIVATVHAEMPSVWYFGGK